MSTETKSKGANNSKIEVNDNFDWSAENEVHLFYALKGHKPVGVNRYFHMICIQDLFNNLVNKEVTSKIIWDHLDKLYDMDALHENEDIPFPNDETDFSLPSSEFEDLIARKISGKHDDSSSSSKSETLMSAGKESGVQSESESSHSKEKKDESKTEAKTDGSPEKQKEITHKDEKDTKNSSSAKKRSQKSPNVNSKSGQTPNNSNGSSSSKKRRV
ncbi:mrg-binding protein-like protein [Leptotrombidium deliense]|uniref:Mrg-binding protein-like protein n=1 Tax=Leptotrombidium deliense TaxID=299467 RepID=A0A443SK68_9ACAR|nr:mrg-binding protein-like protein [Leptotrombidium deliense]